MREHLAAPMVAKLFAAAPMNATPQPARPAHPGISAEDYAWASELELKVNGGYKPTSAEVQRYEDLGKRQAAAKDRASVPQEDVIWALDLEAKFKTGYLLTAARPRATSRSRSGCRISNSLPREAVGTRRISNGLLRPATLRA